MTERLLRLLAGQGRRRGLMGGNRVWLAIWLGAAVVRRVRRSEAKVVYSERLAPGQALVVVNGPAGVDGKWGDGSDRSS